MEAVTYGENGKGGRVMRYWIQWWRRIQMAEVVLNIQENDGEKAQDDYEVKWKQRKWKI